MFFFLVFFFFFFYIKSACYDSKLTKLGSPPLTITRAGSCPHPSFLIFILGIINKCYATFQKAKLLKVNKVKRVFD